MENETGKTITLEVKIPDEDIFILCKVIRTYIETGKTTRDICAGAVPRWIIEEQLIIEKLLTNISEEIEAHVRK